MINYIKRLLGCKCEEKDNEIYELQTKINKLILNSHIMEPQSLGNISLAETYEIFYPLCKNLFLSDNIYNLTSVEQAKKFTEETKVAYQKWTKEEHDCDNFSFASMGYWSEGLKSFAYGIAWSTGHAFNIMIDNNKQIWIVEPQNNIYMTLEQAKEASTPDRLNYFPIRLILM